MSAKSNPVWGVRGGGGPVSHREEGDVHGETNMTDIMSRLQGGTHTRVYDGTSEVDAQDRTIDQLEIYFGKSDRTPIPHVRCQISEGHLPVPMPLPRLTGVIPYLERPPEPLQPETLVG